MYNPSRGGVRGGADQFTWESVKTDKHRENYLGHSLKAPVGRWQKGKDLSWYAKERKDDEDTLKTEKSELAEIKRAEEEAMLIALGHKVVRRETQALSKEEMTEALKRNTGERNELSIERIDGVGATSCRAALLTGASKDSNSKNAGVQFETQREKNYDDDSVKQSSLHKRSKSKKKSKKHKKEKKSKKNQSPSDTDDSETESTTKRKHKKYKSESEYGDKLAKKLHKKKTKHRHPSSSGSESKQRIRSRTHEKHRTQSRDVHLKRRRHDTSSESE